jgi:hypothetical protein
MLNHDRAVLVIHGVANRSRESFNADVDALRDGIGPPWRLIAVYWGDIAAPVAGIADTVPVADPQWSRDARLTDSEAIGGPAGAVSPEDEARAFGLGLLATSRAADPGFTESSVQDPEETVRKAALARLHELGIREDAAVGERIKDVGDELALLARAADGPTLVAMGVTIAERYAGVRSEPALQEGVLIPDWLKHVVDSTVDAVKDAVFGVVDRVGGAANARARAQLLEWLGTGVGDVLLYQGKKQDIQDRVTRDLNEHADGWGKPGRPIPVLAHSLGGIIAFDMAVRAEDRLHIDPLITFGSQSSVLEIFDPRVGVDPHYSPRRRAQLPDSIGHWINVWSSLDVLAFSAKRIFQTRPPDMVQDVRIAYRGDTDLFTHDSYWKDPYMWAEARRALEGRFDS